MSKGTIFSLKFKVQGLKFYYAIFVSIVKENETMKTALIQSDLVWENIDLNLENFEEKIHSVALDTDLIVLPEMFSTGFTMNPEKVAESENGKAVSWLKKTAIKTQKALTGSLVIEENGNYFNRLFFVFPDGNYKTYDKRHLFSLAGEDKKYTSGKEKLIVEYKDWKISLLVCYDLRFPVFSRNTEDYDLLVYVANWPQKRIDSWDILLKARAVENMVYTIGLNRIGTDENQNEYTGHSQIVDYLGKYILEPQISEGIFYATLEKEPQNKTREKLGFLNDRDSFTIY